MDDNAHIKETALRLAVQTQSLYPAPPPMIAGSVLLLADQFAQWLGSSVVSLSIVPDRLTYNQGSFTNPEPTRFTGGKVELKDNQQVPLTVQAKDAKGFATNEAGDVVVTWTSSDESVVVLQPAADGLTCEAVAGNPGSATVQVSDGTRTGSLAFDVTTGGVASIEVVAGEPVDQPPAG